MLTYGLSNISMKIGLNMFYVSIFNVLEFAAKLSKYSTEENKQTMNTNSLCRFVYLTLLMLYRLVAYCPFTASCCVALHTVPEQAYTSVCVFVLAGLAVSWLCFLC